MEEVERAAIALKATGTLLFTVGIESRINVALTRSIATSVRTYFTALSFGSLFGLRAPLVEAANPAWLPPPPPSCSNY